MLRHEGSNVQNFPYSEFFFFCFFCVTISLEGKPVN
jgi:hypothetical protein